MKAIILAAGVGKRLWPVTQHHPKCLIQIGGRTLLARYLDALAGGRGERGLEYKRLFERKKGALWLPRKGFQVLAMTTEDGFDHVRGTVAGSNPDHLGGWPKRKLR